MIDKKSENLKNNGTQINLTAEELLNISLDEVISLENQRIKNIGEGCR